MGPKKKAGGKSGATRLLPTRLGTRLVGNPCKTRLLLLLSLLSLVSRVIIEKTVPDLPTPLLGPE